MKRSIRFLAAAALVATSCGGSAGADDGVASLEAGGLEATADSAAPQMTPEEALFAFAACMREHGIDVADPSVDAAGNLQLTRPQSGPGAEGANPGTLDREAFRTARQECGALLEGVALGFGAEDRTAIEDQMLEFAACMRENGFDMPDPDFSGTNPGSGEGPGRGPFGDIDPSDPAFQTAREACQDILAGSGPGVGGPGGGGPGGGPGRGGGGGEG